MDTRLRSGTRPARTPPSTFLFLPIHLSNSPGPGQSRPPVSRRAVETCGLRSGSEAWSPNISVKSFEDAPSQRGGGVRIDLYRRSRPQMSTPRRGENPPSRCNPATAIFLNDIGGLASVERPSHAALRPHSSVPLVGAVGGVTSGGIASTSHDPRRTAPPID